MDQLLHLLKETAIFMLAAQLLLHFLPGKKYEKYGRMIIALVVLSQLALPILSIGSQGAAEIFWEKFSAMEEENEIFSQKMERLEGADSSLVENGMVASVEERVAEEAQAAGVKVYSVRLREDGVVMIEVKKEPQAGKIEMAGPVEVERIKIGEAAEEEAAQAGAGARKGGLRPELARAFAAALGMGDEKVEVVEIG